MDIGIEPKKNDVIEIPNSSEVLLAVIINTSLNLDVALEGDSYLGIVYDTAVTTLQNGCFTAGENSSENIQHEMLDVKLRLKRSGLGSDSESESESMSVSNSDFNSGFDSSERADEELYGEIHWKVEEKKDGKITKKIAEEIAKKVADEVAEEVTKKVAREIIEEVVEKVL